MIYFKDIFDRAFNLFDDPDLSQRYYYDQAGFQKDMLDYLIIGKNKFMSPAAITDKLLQMDKSQGFFIGDNGDGSQEYDLGTYESEDNDKANTLPCNGGEGCGFSFTINGKYVPGRYYTKEIDGKIHGFVDFYKAVETTDEWGFAWFYAGAFTADFSDCLRSDFPMDALMDKVVNILAYATLTAWGDKEVGRVIEVRNVLTDTDFKMYAPANSARAKVEWRNQMNKDMDTLVSELNWRILSTPKGGSRFGK